jgi:hypothetical protein
LADLAVAGQQIKELLAGVVTTQQTVVVVVVVLALWAVIQLTAQEVLADLVWHHQ